MPCPTALADANNKYSPNDFAAKNAIFHSSKNAGFVKNPERYVIRNILT